MRTTILGLLALTLTASATADPILATGSLRSPTPHASDLYGNAIAAANGLLVIGDRGFDPAPGFGEAGGVWFSRPGKPARHVMNPSMNRAEGFGDVLWANRVGVMAGVWRDDDDGTDAGAAHLFDFDGNLRQSFWSPEPNADDRFGLGVALAGGKAIVSAYKDDTLANDAGAVYLFDPDSGDLLRTLRDPTPHSGDRFGYSIDAFGKYAVVGCYRESSVIGNSGAVYVYDTDDGSLVRSIFNPLPANGDLFAHSMQVSAHGRVAVAATEDSSFGASAGAVFVFDVLSGSLLYTIENPRPDPFDQFGSRVQWVGDSLLVAATSDDTYGTDSGSVYLFGPDGSLSGELMNPDASASDFFGFGLAASQTTIYASVPSDQNGTGTVYTYRVSLPYGPAWPKSIDGPLTSTAVPEPEGFLLIVLGGFFVLFAIAAWKSDI